MGTDRRPRPEETPPRVLALASEPGRACRRASASATHHPSSGCPSLLCARSAAPSMGHDESPSPSRTSARAGGGRCRLVARAPSSRGRQCGGRRRSGAGEGRGDPPGRLVVQVHRPPRTLGARLDISSSWAGRHRVRDRHPEQPHGLPAHFLLAVPAGRFALNQAFCQTLFGCGRFPPMKRIAVLRWNPIGIPDAGSDGAWNRSEAPDGRRQGREAGLADGHPAPVRCSFRRS